MPRARDKEVTRAKILGAAFAEFHRSGYQAADLDTVAEAAGVTRGTLYYHFGDKEGLARTVLRDVALPIWAGNLLERIASSDDPISALSEIVVEEPAAAGDRVLLGCPVNTLAQEVANQSEPIRREIERLYRRVEEEITAALQRGQASGTVRSDVDPREVALFFIAATQGMMGMTKTYQDTGMPGVIGRALIKHLEELRPRST